MSNQDFGRGFATGARGRSDSSKGVGNEASAALSKASDLAQQTVDKAKQAASDTASNLTRQVKEVLDRQVGGGADMVRTFASSARRAAEDLERNAPQAAGLVHALADRIGTYARDLRGQSVDQLVRAASDLTRRQPALVFGQPQ